MHDTLATTRTSLRERTDRVAECLSLSIISLMEESF